MIKNNHITVKKIYIFLKGAYYFICVLIVILFRFKHLTPISELMEVFWLFFFLIKIQF